MDTQFEKDLKLEDVMRASWFAGLAFGNYMAAPPMPDNNSLLNLVFRKRAIDLCD